MRFAWDNAKETILSAEENAHVDAAAPLDVCSATASPRLLFFPLSFLFFFSKGCSHSFLYFSHPLNSLYIDADDFGLILFSNNALP